MIDFQQVAYPRDDGGGQHRVAAEGEEIVMHANRSFAGEAQHLGDNFGKRGLHIIARGTVFGTRASAASGSSSAATACRSSLLIARNTLVSAVKE